MVEYVFASSVTNADQVARKWGWRPWGRTAWHKSDGTVVYYIFFRGQLADIPAGAKVHFIYEGLGVSVRPWSSRGGMTRAGTSP